MGVENQGNGKRIVMAMSGGVDSCVAAVLLKEQGYDVVGITMQLWNHAGSGEERFDSCCSLTDVHDARLAAHTLGIPHYVVNYEKEFRSGVVDYFAAEYQAGRTPNPCVMCNSKLKFDHLIDRAKALGTDLVATGHYARLEHTEQGPRLFRGLDARKDQSYFLFDMKRENLAKAVFPLGALTKKEVREIATAHGIHTAQKHESQEICFVSGKRYSDFLQEHYPHTLRGVGDVVDMSGKVLGQHEGIHLYTVGQRKGLGHLHTTTPLFVIKIRAEENQVVVGDRDDLATPAFCITPPNWLVDPKDWQASDELSIVVRYRAAPIPCRIEPRADGTWQVWLAEAARWVSPGQAAVLYRQDEVLGGGFIATQSCGAQKSQAERSRGSQGTKASSGQTAQSPAPSGA